MARVVCKIRKVVAQCVCKCDKHEPLFVVVCKACFTVSLLALSINPNRISTVFSTLGNLHVNILPI